MKNHHLHDLQGERKNQLLIVTDKKGTRIGTATRHECHKGKGKTHLAFMAFIFKNKKIVLAKRSAEKSLWSGYWDASVVSHVLANEKVEEAAYRRGKEELGVKVNFKELGAFYYFAKHGDSAENEYCHVLIGKYSGEISPNSVEIEETREISPEELKKAIKDNPKNFTPWLITALSKYGDKI